MIIRVLMPFENWQIEFFEIKEDFRNGQIVEISDDVYGIAVNEADFEVGKVKTCKVADEMGVIQFWMKMDFKILNSPLTIRDRALSEYRQTRGNTTLPLETVKKKLKRNLLLSYRSNRIPVTDESGIILQYGCLKFIVHNNEIVYLKRIKRAIKGWKKSEIRYNHFTKILEIEGL